MSVGIDRISILSVRIHQRFDLPCHVPRIPSLCREYSMRRSSHRLRSWHQSQSCRGRSVHVSDIHQTLFCLRRLLHTGNLTSRVMKLVTLTMMARGYLIWGTELIQVVQLEFTVSVQAQPEILSTPIYRTL